MSDGPRIERDPHGRKIYVPDGPTLCDFVLARNEVDIIRGPIGSGSSSALCMRIWSHAVEQRPGPDGVRRSRWAVIRSTFTQLRDTTLKTWAFWFEPELYGPVNLSRPFVHRIVLPKTPEEPGIDLEVIFLALDDEQDIAKLRSLELTGVAFNEVEFTGKSIFDEAQSRTGRFPPIALGGPNWYGVIADMNAPGEDHWVPMLMGEVALPEEWTEEERRAWQRPDGWGYFVQPPALLETLNAEGEVIGYRGNPDAENVRWLPADYYARTIKGKTKTWIDSRVMNRITLYVEGDPVWPTFRAETHVAREPLRPHPGYPVYVGLDFGRNPAALFCQEIGGRVFVQYELIGRNEGASRFAPKVKSLLAERYGWGREGGCREVRLIGDPKGQDKTQSDERTAYDIFKSFGLPVQAATFLRQTNDVMVRIEAGDYLFGKMVDGKPGILISPLCRKFKMACAGGYHWAKTGDGKKVPEKDTYADIADAGQYVFLGIGTGRRMTALPDAMQRRPSVGYRKRLGRGRYG